MPEKILTVVSYNVKHCAGGIKAVADMIMTAEPDIAGIQEVDMFTRRADQDEPLLLSHLTGMKYYRFTPAMDFMGGQYGTLILSKYPITEYETVKLVHGGPEPRRLGHALIDLGGVTVDFFNTHLAFEGKNEREPQFSQLGEIFADKERYILTGDFNTEDFSEFAPIGAAHMVNRDGSKRVTFPGSGRAIDNIVLSGGFEELSCTVTEGDQSDHWMLSAKLRLTY